MLCANVEALIELFGLSGPCSCLAAQSRSSRRCRCPRCLGARPNATCRRQKTGWAGRSFPATGLRRPTARTSTRCACWARTSLRTSWWGWRTSTPNKVGPSMKMFRYKFSQSTYCLILLIFPVPQLQCFLRVILPPVLQPLSNLQDIKSELVLVLTSTTSNSSPVSH